MGCTACTEPQYLYNGALYLGLWCSWKFIVCTHMVYVADCSCLLQHPTSPSPTIFVFYAPYDKYLERKLFCSSVIYDKAYIGFFFVSWEILFCLEKLLYFSTSHKVGVIWQAHLPSNFECKPPILNLIKINSVILQKRRAHVFYAINAWRNR